MADVVSLVLLLVSLEPVVLTGFTGITVSLPVLLVSLLLVLLFADVVSPVGVVGSVSTIALLPVPLLVSLELVSLAY